jgi:hypothetical protein
MMCHSSLNLNNVIVQVNQTSGNGKNNTQTAVIIALADMNIMVKYGGLQNYSILFHLRKKMGYTIVRSFPLEVAHIVLYLTVQYRIRKSAQKYPLDLVGRKIMNYFTNSFFDIGRSYMRDPVNVF